MAKTRRLIWLPEAAADLERLRLFLQPLNPQAAQRMARRILEAVKLLKRHSEAGRPVEDPTGFRDLVIPFGGRGYVLRYRSLESGEIVVVKVWHEREERG